jgi:transposase
VNRLTLSTIQRRQLEHQLQQASDVRVYRRTFAVLEFCRGRSVAEIAESLGVTRQSVYNWIEAYSQEQDPLALQDESRSGRPRLWTEGRRSLLRRLLETSPDQLGYFATSWTVPLLGEQIEQHSGIRLSDASIRGELHRQRFVWKRPRYVLAPDADREKKTLSDTLDKEAGTKRPALCRG